MGDDPWIGRLSTRVRRFNYVGDAQWMRGRLDRVDARPGPPQVEVTVAAVDQRGETTCQGKATMLITGTDAQQPELPRVAALDDLPARL
jgi:hypothetical protein